MIQECFRVNLAVQLSGKNLFLIILLAKTVDSILFRTYMAKCRCHCYSWHYQHSLSCAEDGTCICKEGWTGPECWTNIIVS